MASIGYLLPTREVLMADSGFGELLSLAEMAETEGFDSVWVGDSILARPRFELMTTLAAVAARTKRVTLGSAVMLPALRQPVILANEIANLDHIAGGRLQLGLGMGSKTEAGAKEFTACGVPPTERVGRFEETVAIMRRLWTEPSVSFTGRYFQLDDVRPVLRPVQPSGPPLWFAGSVEPAFQRVVRMGDGWQPNSPTPEAFREASSRLSEIAREQGRDPARLHRSAYTTINVNAIAAQAHSELKAFIEGYYNSPFEVQSKRQGVCSGDAATCIDWLQRFTVAGANSIVVRFGGPDQRAQMRAFVDQVLPKLR